MKIEEKILTTKKFRADMHNHTSSSIDSECPIDELCLAHIKRGTDAIAITDHLSIEAHNPDTDVCECIAESFEKATEAKEKYANKLEILRGVEIGAALWHRDIEKSILERFDFDVVIGSVHTTITKDITIPYSWVDFTDTPKEHIETLLEAYFDEVLNTALYSDFDILAHINCPFRYINGKYNRGFDEMNYEPVIRKILSAVIARGKSLELNTSNCSFCDSFFMPDKRILSIYRDLGGRMISIGSDAHFSKNAAIAFDDAEKMLKNLGFSQLCFYRKRQPYFYDI